LLFLQGESVCIDYSHPNIAKPLHFGHFRSTVIGESLVRILRHAGAKVLADNYLGDFGTQFGKLIVAIQRWGDEEVIRQDPINELVKLYQKIHEEIKTNPELEDQGREEFRKIEQDRDPDNIRLWEWIVKVSYEQLEKFYQRLDINFDVIRGESEWEKYIPEVLQLMKERGVIKKDNGAYLAFFAEETKLPPMIYQRSDGASLYQTRDIARIYYHEQEGKYNHLLYVVDEGQSLHFRQLKETARLLGFKIKITQAPFGFVLGEDNKKLSTRGGTSLGVDFVLDEAEERVAKILEEKQVQTKNNLSSEELAKLKKIIAIGAVKFNDLGQNRIRSITFNWEKILSFEGYSAPFLQYSYARAQSILRKNNEDICHVSEIVLTEEKEIFLVKKILHFPEIIQDAALNFKPHILAEYLYELAQDFNRFYAAVSVLNAEGNTKKSRLLLVQKTAEVLKEGLYLLGIEVPEKM
jgi:arginyl-tRNA synthetase